MDDKEFDQMCLFWFNRRKAVGEKKLEIHLKDVVRAKKLDYGSEFNSIREIPYKELETTPKKIIKEVHFMNLKIFTYSSKFHDDYGIDCALVIAETKEEALDILKDHKYELLPVDAASDDIREEDIVEVPFEKGYKYIGGYSE